MKHFRRVKTLNRERGSMPIALFITIMFLALSVALIGIVASQVAQNKSEDNARQAHIALGSAIAISAEQIGPSARALVNLPIIEPLTWAALGNDTNNSFYHWWVSSSSNSVLVPSNIPVGNWASVTYGNNIWVAVNTAGTAFTSPDGLTWTQRNALPNVGTLNYTNLTYGLGSFIATPSTAAANIATSPDGIVWTSVTIASGTYIPSCSTTTCVFLSTTSAAGYYTTNLTSFNAMTSVPFIAKAVTFAISSFVMSGNNAIATSIDASTWTSRTVSAHNWGLVGSVNGAYVAADVQAAGSKAIVTSTDGITWTDRTLAQAGNWIAIATAGPQIGLFSGPIASINQSSYLSSSTGTTWVSSPLPAGAPWVAASGNYKSFFVMQATNPSYLIPVSGSVSAAQNLTVTTRVQQGRVTNANNGQYYASIVYTWNVAGKKWLASKYVGPSTPGLSLVPNAPTGVTGTRTAPGVINVSWIPPANSGSSAVSSYLATSSAGGYYCASGAQLSGTTCTTTSTSVASHTAITYQCTSGDTPSGIQSSAFTCTKTTTYAANYTASTYNCNNGDTPSGIQATAVTCTHTTTYAANYQPPVYQCPSGDTPSGTQTTSFTCTHTVGANYSGPTYQCTSGDTPSGIQGAPFTCTHTSSSTYSSPQTSAAGYNCSSGTLSGSNCLNTYSPSSCPSGSSISGSYCCPSGYVIGTSGNSATLPGSPGGSYINCYKYLGDPSHAYWQCSGGYPALINGGWYTGYPDYWKPIGLDSSGSPDNKPKGQCANYASEPTSSSYSTSYPTNVPIVCGSNAQFYTSCSNGPSSVWVPPSSYPAQDNQKCPSGGTPATGINPYTCTISGSGSTYPATGTGGGTTYSCNAGDSLSVSTCTHTYTNYTATATTGCAAGTGTLTYNSSSSTYTCVLAGSTYTTKAGCGSNTEISYNSSTGASTCQYPPTSNGTIRIYSCTTGDTLSGQTCIPNPSSSTYPATSSGGTTTYSCPSGGTNTGNSSTCTIADSSSTYTSSHVNYTCPSGGTLSGSTCNSPLGYTAGISINDYCGGATFNAEAARPGDPWASSSSANSANGPSGLSCYQFQAGTALICNTGDTLSGSTCTNTIPATSIPAVYQCTSGDTPVGTQSSAFTCTNTVATTYPSPGSAGYYYCSSGTLSGTSCLTTYASPLTTVAYYYCTSGDTPVSTSATTFTCTHTATYPAPVLVVAYYSCNAGDTPVSTSATTFTCTHTTTYLSSGTAAFYSCSSGILSGNLCLTSSTYSGTYNSGGYTCSSGTQTNCTISGMTNGVYTFTVTAANNAGTSVASIASALTAPQLLALSYPSTVFSIGQTSQVLTPLVTGSSGASLTYSESGTLPSGVTFNTSTGALMGPLSWASQVGYPFTLTVTATDNLTGYTISAPITFTLITP